MLITFTVVPAPGDNRPAKVHKLTSPTQIPAMQADCAEMLEQPGAIGITTNASGDVLMVITDDGCAVLDPGVNKAVRRDLHRYFTSKWN